MRRLGFVLLNLIWWTLFTCWTAACGGGGSYDPGETTAAACSDEVDNDDDGDVDCDDADCQGFVFCLPPTEATAAACDNGRDDDGDGDTDCDDSDCQGFVFCAGDGSEDTAAACDNGRDDDGDGATDCDDDECSGFAVCQGGAEDTAALCQNGMDDDGDGATDCDDEDCAGLDVCSPNGSEELPSECQDGVDNDDDGDTDCDDSGCAGYVFCLPAGENTAARCRDGQDNDGDGRTDCADADCQGYTFCADGGENTRGACDDGVDNDADGATDCDDEGCWAWAFCQHYQGYPLVDSWGETFDGIERPGQVYTEAAAVCEDLGGRLPTVTELWRNNAGSGTGDLSDDAADNMLWTRIGSAGDGQRVVVRLSDGAVGVADEQTPQRFRCIWPDTAGAGFDQARCHGAPGEPCWRFDRLWNVDAHDRPAVDLAAAVNECAFYGASVPVVAEWGQMIHAGLPNGTGGWLWAANAMFWYPGNYGAALVAFDAESRQRWRFAADAGMGGIDNPGNAQRFRCVGLADPAAHPAPQGECSAACVTFDDRRSQLVADDSDREALRWSDAAAVCHSAGGELPNAAEMTELIHAGWIGGSEAWLWLTDPIRWFDGTNGYYGLALARWTDAGADWWTYVSGRGGYSPAADARSFRCVFRPSGPPLPPCQPGQVVNWNGASFSCAQRVDGSSGGQAHVIEIVDDFGNAWDGIQREQAAWADAQTTCADAGGRLPTASELYAVRAEGNPHDPIGDVTSTSPLWTSTPAAGSGNRILVRVSDGASSQVAEDAVQYFRCIWPASRGDVLAASNCYGPPDDPCFRTGDGLLADRYDRAAADASAAMEECRAVGGRLPDQRELARLIQSGLDNGSDEWLWIAEPLYWYSGGYGYAVVKWLDAGAPGWEPVYPDTASWSDPGSFHRFRCVYSSRLR